MPFTKLTFHRGQQVLILQGMMHYGEKRIYNKIQKDVDLYSQQGYIFMEEGGFGSVDSYKFEDPEEEAIAKCLGVLLGMCAALTEGTELVTQFDSIESTVKSVFCDLSFPEIVRALHAQGFLPNPRYMHIVQNLADLERAAQADPQRALELQQEIYMLEEQRRTGTDPVLLHRRNRRFVQTTEKYLRRKPDGKIYAHWGSYHLPGITRRLLMMRWALVKRQRLLAGSFD